MAKKNIDANARMVGVMVTAEELARAQAVLRKLNPYGDPDTAASAVRTMFRVGIQALESGRDTTVPNG